MHMSYSRATIKGKVFQLRFLEEVRPDAGKAERSQATGHLLVTLPKLRIDTIVAAKATTASVTSKPKLDPRSEQNPLLEISNGDTDYKNIVTDPDEMPPLEDV